MRYADYRKSVYTVEDIEKYKKRFEEDITNKQNELEEFIIEANKRIEQIQQWEKEKNYSVLGGTHKGIGRNKEILFIIRYPDLTQRDQRYSFTKIADLRVKLQELKEKHSGVDWSMFIEEV